MRGGARRRGHAETPTRCSPAWSGRASYCARAPHDCASVATGRGSNPAPGRLSSVLPQTEIRRIWRLGWSPSQPERLLVLFRRRTTRTRSAPTSICSTSFYGQSGTCLGLAEVLATLEYADHTAATDRLPADVETASRTDYRQCAGCSCISRALTGSQSAVVCSAARDKGRRIRPTAHTQLFEADL